MQHEPTLIVLAVVNAGIALAIAFGVPISLEQQAALIGFITALLGAGALVIRSQVASPAAVERMEEAVLEAQSPQGGKYNLQ